MQFLYPSFLWALLLLAIPIIIHLFHFRRFKKVHFSNVAFLKEVKEEVSARRKLRNLLVLLSRLLAIAFLVMAFARPVMRDDGPKKQGIPHMGIIIDNSFSMENESEDVSLLERTKSRAIETLNALPESHRVSLLTNDMEGRHQNFYSKNELINYIEELQPSPTPFDFNILSEKMTRLLKSQDSEDLSAVIYSDFQVDQELYENSQVDTTIQWLLVPFQSVQESNVSIDSVWLNSPVQVKGETAELMIKTKNYGKQAAESIRLAMSLNGESKPVSSFNLAPAESRVDTAIVNLTDGGWYKLKFSITDYPVQFDDEYYVSFEVPDNIGVLVISDRNVNKYLEAAMESPEIFETSFQNSGNISYSDFPSYSFIVLNELNNFSSGLMTELESFVKRGGNLYVIPARQMSELTNYNTLLRRFGSSRLSALSSEERKVQSINTSELVFKDVFERNSRNLSLPKTKANYPLARNVVGLRTILSYRDGSPFLVRNQFGQGNVFLMSSSLDLKDNDLVGHAEIFVPLLYRMAVSAGGEKKIALMIGERDEYPLRNNNPQVDPIFKLRGQETELIPRVNQADESLNLFFSDEITRNGFYDLFQDEEQVSSLSFNYNRAESALNYLNSSVLESNPRFKVISESEYQSNLGSVLASHGIDREFWRWCLIFALVFLLAESALLRWYKIV